MRQLVFSPGVWLKKKKKRRERVSLSLLNYAVDVAVIDNLSITQGSCMGEISPNPPEESPELFSACWESEQTNQQPRGLVPQSFSHNLKQL